MRFLPSGLGTNDIPISVPPEVDGTKRVTKVRQGDGHLSWVVVELRGKKKRKRKREEEKDAGKR